MDDEFSVNPLYKKINNIPDNRKTIPGFSPSSNDPNKNTNNFQNPILNITLPVNSNQRMNNLPHPQGNYPNQIYYQQNQNTNYNQPQFGNINSDQNYNQTYKNINNVNQPPFGNPNTNQNYYSSYKNINNNQPPFGNPNHINNNSIRGSNKIQQNKVIPKIYPNKYGLMIDSIVPLNTESEPFQNYLSIRLSYPNSDELFQYDYENFEFIVVTRNKSNIINKYQMHEFLEIKNNKISNEHCLFEVYQNKLYLRDIGSTNGSFVRLKNNESLPLYQETSFIFLDLNFTIVGIYMIGLEHYLDISVECENPFKFNIKSSQNFEISPFSTENILNSAILMSQKLPQTRPQKGNYPIIIFNYETSIFNLINQNNSVDDIYVRLDNTKNLTEEIKNDHYIIVNNKDIFSFGLDSFVEVSFSPFLETTSCSCVENSSQNFICHNGHGICQFCHNNGLCEFCCYCHYYGTLPERSYFSCLNKTHPVCQFCQENSCCNQCSMQFN